VEVLVGVEVRVGVRVGVALAVTVMVGVRVIVGVALGVRVGVLVGVADMTSASKRGRRSRLLAGVNATRLKPKHMSITATIAPTARAGEGVIPVLVLDFLLAGCSDSVMGRRISQSQSHVNALAKDI
jgi:hypothetical protein